MKIYDFSTCLREGLLKGHDIALAIGVFDGVHLGHRKIFTTLSDYRLTHPGCETCVITFAVNPKNINTPSLDTLRLRCSYIESFFTDYTLVIDFSRDFSMISGREFIHLLCTMCRVNAVIVGEDFRCGYAGNQITASEMSLAFESEGVSADVMIIPPVLDAGRVRISSTRLRKLLAQGDIAAVNRLAGSAYRYDLTENVFVRQDGWYTSTAVTGQGLPGDGEYNAVLIFLNKSSEDCVLKVAGRKLFIRSSAPLDRITADSIMILS